jgi:hypothetical protein
MTPAYRRLLKWSRLAHVYLTLFGLVLILGFAITGFMLNHESWFLPTEPWTRQAEGMMPANLLHPVDRLGVVETLRNDFGAAGAVSSFREDDDGLEVELVRPGMRVVASVRLADGQTTVQFETRGWAGILMDLHKGKSAGWAWGWVIDGVCVLLLAVAATGLVLWWSLRGRGKWGAVVLLCGTALAVAVYYWLVP